LLEYSRFMLFQTGSNTPPNGQIVIGKKNQSPYPPEQFFGLIDEVAVYNRALSDEEIKSISEEAAPAKPASAH